MANKIYALRLKRDFEHLYKKGWIFKEKNLVIRCVFTSENRLRLAWGISRKIIRKAVQRNKIKRWGREFLRTKRLFKDQGMNILIHIRGEIKNYAEFKTNMELWTQKWIRKKN